MSYKRKINNGEMRLICDDIKRKWSARSFRANLLKHRQTQRYDWYYKRYDYRMKLEIQKKNHIVD